MVLVNPSLDGSAAFADVSFAAFTGNPVNHAILFNRVNSVLRCDGTVVSDLKTARALVVGSEEVVWTYL